MIIKNIKQKIKDFFFTYPTKRLRVRQIEREIHVSLPSAIRYASELEKEKILKSEIIGNIKLYSADRVSEKYKLEKKLHNIMVLQPLVKDIIIRYSNPTIILFGSFSRGEDIESSDIDLYIETPLKKMDLEKHEKIMKKNIQLFIFKSIHDIKNKELANNIINGIKLNGYLEIFR